MKSLTVCTYLNRKETAALFSATLVTVLVLLAAAVDAPAVSTSVTRHSSQADLLKGKPNNVIIDSRGRLELAPASRTLAGDFEDVWAINDIVCCDDALLLGTSPNGRIYQYRDGELALLYPLPETESGQSAESDTSPAEPNSAQSLPPRITNDHIFAMAFDRAGRLLAGVSGQKCRLLRFSPDANADTGWTKAESVFEPNDAKYIFAIVLDADKNIYLGTGPEGKIYRLSPDAAEARLVYDAEDKNILCLATGDDGFIYAGTDDRAVVYKINTSTQTASILYDTEQAEVAALLFDSEGNLYAAATSEQAVKNRAKISSPTPSDLPGRPEQEKPESPSPGSANGLKLQVPNTAKSNDNEDTKKAPHPARGTKPATASHIYKITPNGFVTDVFSQQVVFYAMGARNDNILVATGNSAQLYRINPATEQQTVPYQDERASQITALAVAENLAFLGTANPAGLIEVEKSYAAEGTYISELIDATQPARWGKLHLEADIPESCRVLVSARSGNVKDVNDPTFSPWTEPVQADRPIQLFCPIARYCQYKLALATDDADETPVIREIAVAHSVPNLAPQVESVTVERVENEQKLGHFKISFKATDDNNDKLIYALHFRRVGRDRWIKLKDELEQDNFEWDGRTVEDGRYEIKVTGDDRRDNSSDSALSDSRISDAIIVDNTPPDIEYHSLLTSDHSARLTLRVTDKLSTIGEVSYTVDSNDEWKKAVADDGICDTTAEDFTILIKDLEPGPHVIALRIQDAANNTDYRTFDVTIED